MSKLIAILFGNVRPQLKGVFINIPITENDTCCAYEIDIDSKWSPSFSTASTQMLGYISLLYIPAIIKVAVFTKTTPAPSWKKDKVPLWKRFPQSIVFYQEWLASYVKNIINLYLAVNRTKLLWLISVNPRWLLIWFAWYANAFGKMLETISLSLWNDVV